MGINIRRASKSDMPDVLKLIKELAVFEKEPEAVIISESDLISDGYGKNPQFFCFVAEDNGTIVGAALAYYRYSTWKGKVLHLEDLIVSEDNRGKGLGTLLLNEVVKFASLKKVKRLSWEVLDWNTAAIEFYEKKGAKVMRDWHVVQLDELGIKNYIDNI